MMFFSGHLSRYGTIQALLTHGAIYAPRVSAGEWWRLLTGMFLHASVFHLVVNMVVFWKVGMLVERILGNAGYALLYLVSGLCAGVASLHATPGMVSVGASGAVFGVYGGLLGLLTRYHIYIQFKSILKFTLFVLFLLANGFYENHARQFPRVDMAAHVGGFISGFIMGAILALPLGAIAKHNKRVRHSWIAGGAGVIVLVGLLTVRRVNDVVLEFVSFGETESRLFAKFNKAVNQYKAGQIVEGQLAETIERQVLPEWVTAVERLEAVKDFPEGYAPLISKLMTYTRLRRQGLELLVEAIRSNDAQKMKKSQEMNQAAESVVRQILEDIT
jgi:rhomboid protease GluP